MAKVKMGKRAARRLADATATEHAKALSTKLDAHTSDADDGDTYLQGVVGEYDIYVGGYQRAVTDRGAVFVALGHGPNELARVHGVPYSLHHVEKVTSWLRRWRNHVKLEDGLVGVQMGEWASKAARLEAVYRGSLPRELA